MSQSAFLSKLCEFKAFKIVESPETTKRNAQQPLPAQPTQAFVSMSTLQSQKVSSDGSSNPHFNLCKTQSYNPATPNKKDTDPSIGNSEKKITRKYSNQQAASPHRITLSKKTQSINSKGLSVPECLKTPNKENNLPIGTMIQSHLYTNLSSSIDTLFSKIEKIKLEFQCPQSGNKINRSIGSSENRQNKNMKQEGLMNPRVRQISEYSPILKPSLSKDMSSMSSLSPLLNQSQNIPKRGTEQVRNSYNKNKNLVNIMYTNNLQNKSPFNESQSIKSQNFMMPATHHNINEVSSKTRTIIDEINLLLDSNKKKNPCEQMPKLAKYKKMNTQVYDRNELQYSANKHQDIGEEDSDQLDGQFLTIKLKNTQSQYAPKLIFPTNSCDLTGSVKSKIDRQYENLCFKIEQPLQTEPTPCITQYDQYGMHFQKFSPNPPIYQNWVPNQLNMRQFQLGKCVGSGKFGDVHICKHKATGFLFALKKIFKSTIKQYNMIDQFTQQLKIHYTLSNNHPNIAKLYTHFHDEYHIFLLMEYIEDGTLMNQLKKSEEYVSSIIAQVLDAIEYIHRNHVAHRDLKPENILLTNGVAKLCDFGWSSRFKDQMRSTFCGTLDYVSPEMKDRGQYNTSVDLWSIGVLTFQLLAGFPPHKKEIDKWKIMGAKIKQKWRWDVIFPPEISLIAQSFIQKLLKQNPEQRISIRECRQQEFITRYAGKENGNNFKAEFSKIMS